MNFPGKPRCVMAYPVPPDRATRCHIQAGHGDTHIGFDRDRYHKVKWFSGDAREFQSSRKAILSWKTQTKEKK